MGDPGAECWVAEEGTAFWTEGLGGVRHASMPCKLGSTLQVWVWEEIWGGSRKEGIKKIPRK